MYRTVDAKFWTDPKIRGLDPMGKLLALYLVTNPHTHVGGIYYLPDQIIESETGIKNDDLARLWKALDERNYAKRDDALSVVWVVRMFFYQGRGDKHERSVINHLDTLHNSFLINEFLSEYPSVKDRVSMGYPAQVHFGPQEQEKEKEQEQEKEQEKKTATPRRPTDSPAFDPLKITIPSELDTPAFKAAWSEWIKYRRESRMSLREMTVNKQLKLLASFGSAGAVESIEASIRNGWQGLFEQKGGANGKRPTTQASGGSRMRYREDAADASGPGSL